MNFGTLQSSNPVLNNEQVMRVESRLDEARGTQATMAGVISRTTILVTITMAAGIFGYWLFSTAPAYLWLVNVGALLIAIGLCFVLSAKPMLAPILAPVYAVAEGVVLGGVTLWAEAMLASRGIEVPGGVAFQALIITGGVMAAMLMLYRAGVIKPTNTFVSVMSAAVTGIMLAYLASFLLSLFGFTLPFLSLGSVMETGTAGWIGLGVNLVVLVMAALWLVVDFRRVDEIVSSGAPRSMEWYGAFALLVTLAWIYWESVKLVVRLAILFNRRD